MSTVRETKLSNGLTVLTEELHNAPVATLWVWYRVGSRNEVPGQTGISHWVEHMMFKGTSDLKKGDVFKLVNRNGGVNNAFTSMDYTAYFESLPSDRLELALDIESDRMVNAVFDSAEVDSERTVIISEREGSENDPHHWLGEEVQALAFKVQPYHHQTIGWKSDLQKITRDQLYGHYRKYYVPNNAIVVAAGDFDSDELLTRLDKKFGRIPRGADVPAVRFEEPPQNGERRVVVKRPGATAALLIGYHAPDVTHPDFYPLLVLAGALSGTGALAVTHDASPGRSSRLYRALVEKELAVDVGADYMPTLDPFLFMVSAIVSPGVSIAKVERAILAELEKVKHDPIKPNEFAKVMKQARAQYVFAEDGVANRGFRLGMLEVLSSHKMYESFLDNLQAVTAEDVQRVANTYLGESNRTVGWFDPTANGDAKTRMGTRQR
jgi:zinc protease